MCVCVKADLSILAYFPTFCKHPHTIPENLLTKQNISNDTKTGAIVVCGVIVRGSLKNNGQENVDSQYLHRLYSLISVLQYICIFTIRNKFDIENVNIKFT